MTAPSIQQWLELVADYEAQPGRQLKAFAEEHDVDAMGLDDILVAAARRHDGLTISRVARPPSSDAAWLASGSCGSSKKSTS